MVLLLFIFPILGALISLVVKRKVWVLEMTAAVSTVSELIAALFIMSAVVKNGRYDWSSYFSVDSLGAVVMGTVAVIGTAAVFYSIGFLRQEVEKQIIGFNRTKEYFILFQLFMVAMYFAITTVNPILMWIGIESTTLSTAFLISIYNKPSALEAAWKYLIINSLALLLGFLGTLLFFTALPVAASSGLVSWSALLANTAHFSPFIARMALIFVMIGYGTKVGLVPMHAWKPDAYGKASTPIAALFSGALLNVALMAIMRFKIVTDAAIGVEFSHRLFLIFGILSLAIPAFIVLVQRNYKRLFTYSSIEHAGIMALGFGFGGLGIFAALLHMIYHSLAKATLFFASGNMLLKFSSSKIANVRGVLTALPVTAVLLIAGFLAVTGVPPFGIFVTEFTILSVGFTTHLPLALCSLVFLVMIFVGFLRHIVSLVFGTMPDGMTAGEASEWTLVPPVVLAVLLLAMSVYVPGPVMTLLRSAAAVIR